MLKAYVVVLVTEKQACAQQQTNFVLQISLINKQYFEISTSTTVTLRQLLEIKQKS